MSLPAPLELPAWLEPAVRGGLAMRSHALLLHAPGPSGQFELALEIARARLCEAPAADGSACGQCPACHLFAARSHPDGLVLIPDALRERLGWADPEDSESKSKAKPSRDIKVDAVRAAIDWMQRTASRGRAKVLVIHPAEALNAIAANALLKTLEEPPGSRLVLLTANDPESLMPTVRSRCQRLALPMPQPAQARDWLQGKGVAEPATLLAAAGGLPQAALAMHEEGIGANAWRALPAAVRKGDAAVVAAWPVARVVEALHKLCHDLMRLAAAGTPSYFDRADLHNALGASTPRMAALVAWQRELALAARHDEHPWNAPLRAEALFAQARALWQTPRPAAPGRRTPLDTLPGP